MTKYLKFVVASALLISLALGLFALFNQSYGWMNRIIPSKINAKACPLTSEDEFRAYAGTIAVMVDEAIHLKRDPNTYAQIAQAYKALEIRHAELNHPECVNPLFQRIDKAFRYNALAYAAKVEGGLFSEIEFYFYSTMATRNLMEIPFLIYELEPPMEPPEGYYQSV